MLVQGILLQWLAGLFLLKRVGSIIPFEFLFLVKGITVILLVFMDAFVLPQCC
jgi:hypothetical protein